MKKLVLALAIMATAAVSVGQTVWQSRDVAQIQQRLDAANNIGSKINMSILLACVQNPPADFAAFCVLADDVTNALAPDVENRIRIDAKKVYPLNSYTYGWIPDAWNFCKANPTEYDIHYLRSFSLKQLGETPDGYCQQIYKILADGVKDAGHAHTLFGRYNAQLPKSGIPRAERYAQLQMLNDIYTAKLIQDKAAWGDLIAQIRTVMELYK